MATITMKVRTTANTTVDSSINKIEFDEVPYEWEDDNRYWYWFYGLSPYDLEYRISSSKMLEVNLEGVWTEMKWVFDARPGKIDIEVQRGNKWETHHLLVAQGVVHEVMPHPFTNPSGPFSLQMAHHRKNFDDTFKRHRTRPVDRVPLIPPMTEEVHARLLAKAVAGFEEVWDKYHRLNLVQYIYACNLWSERMTNLGYPTNPMEEEKYLSMEKIIHTPFFHHKGAVFVGDKVVTVTKHTAKIAKDEKSCECFLCEHDQEAYEDEDTCCCANCIKNMEHYEEAGENPQHCDFCTEFAKHLKAHSKKGKDEEDDNK